MSDIYMPGATSDPAHDITIHLNKPDAQNLSLACESAVEEYTTLAASSGTARLILTPHIEMLQHLIDMIQERK